MCGSSTTSLVEKHPESLPLSIARIIHVKTDQLEVRIRRAVVFHNFNRYSPIRWGKEGRDWVGGL